jgi:hypothetical protein
MFTCPVPLPEVICSIILTITQDLFKKWLALPYRTFVSFHAKALTFLLKASNSNSDSESSFSPLSLPKVNMVVALRMLLPPTSCLRIALTSCLSACSFQLLIQDPILFCLEAALLPPPFSFVLASKKILEQKTRPEMVSLANPSAAFIWTKPGNFFRRSVQFRKNLADLKLPAYLLWRYNSCLLHLIMHWHDMIINQIKQVLIHVLPFFLLRLLVITVCVSHRLLHPVKVQEQILY